MTRKQRRIKVAKRRAWFRSLKKSERRIFLWRYGRQIRAVARFWSDTLREACGFDNSERELVQLESQALASVGHQRMVKELAPEDVDRFERILAELITEDLKGRETLSLGLRYQPDTNSTLELAARLSGIWVNKSTFPWDTWTHIILAGVKVCKPGAEEEWLPLPAVA